MIKKNRAMMLRVEYVLRTIGAACLLAVMCIVFIDASARYFLNAPLAWSYELIGLYLMPALFYLALSDTLADNHHIAVDLLRPRMPSWLLRIIEVLGNAAMCAVFLVIAWIYLRSSWHDFSSGAVTMGVVEWPAWIPEAIVVVGTVSICLRLVGRTVGHAMSLVCRRSVIDLPASVED
jgi:TRAP-type C4-dicarboxylate transport system permease small subunit